MKVTLHVSVWVEMKLFTVFTSAEMVTLHVSVWVEIWPLPQRLLIGGHAPRERVSWNYLYAPVNCKVLGHAPRERVSWNFQFDLCCQNIPVTLHVSVWVEISKVCLDHMEELVTLHVSVWVEMQNCYALPLVFPSRSTWACELKLV